MTDYAKPQFNQVNNKIIFIMPDIFNFLQQFWENNTFIIEIHVPSLY